MVKDEYVGTGASGQIFIAQDSETGKEVAIKMIRGIYSNERIAQNLWREVFHHLQVMGHANIVNMCRVVIFDEEGTAAILTELHHSSMLSHARTGWDTPEELNRFSHVFAYNILSALAHIHSKGIVHSDIKLASEFQQYY